MEGALSRRIRNGGRAEPEQQAGLDLRVGMEQPPRKDGPVGVDNFADNVEGSPPPTWVHRHRSLRVH